MASSQRARRSGWQTRHGAGGLASVQISRIERGVREVRLITLLRLLKALDVPPEELLHELL